MSSSLSDLRFFNCRHLVLTQRSATLKLDLKQVLHTVKISQDRSPTCGNTRVGHSEQNKLGENVANEVNQPLILAARAREDI